MPLRAAILSVLVSVAPVRAADVAYERDVAPLLAKYCHSCHGDQAKPKGGLSLSKITTAADAAKSNEIWKEVFTTVRGKEMPPDGKPQPTAAERAKLLGWLELQLATPDLNGARDPGAPVLRRLTRLEYNNTVRDLLGLSTDLFMLPERLPLKKAYFDPAAGRMPATLKLDFYEYGAKVPVFLRQAGLPGENRAAHGFTNRGDALSVSPLLIEKYLAVAGEIADHPQLLGQATRLSPLFGEVAKMPTVPKKAGATPVTAAGRFGPADNVKETAKESAGSLADFRRSIETLAPQGLAGVFAGPPGEHKLATVRGDGKTAIRVTLAAGREVVVTPTADLWLVNFASVTPSSPPAVIANKDKGKKVYELALGVEGLAPDERLTDLGLVVLSRNRDAGEVRVTAHYSDGTSTTLTHTLAEGSGKGNTFFAFAAPKGESVSTLRIDGSKFSGDHVLVDDIGFVVRGKDIAAVEPKTAEKPKAADKLPPVETRFRAFLERAFRKPITGDTLALYLKPYHAAKTAGATEAEAIRAAIKGVLVAPEFLFLVEPVDATQGPVRPLDDYELAARLSYFLWASLPDDELLKLAAEGKLRDAKVLEAQARRMLKDPKVRELSESFAVQWLRLNELWAAQPDRQLFKSYYSGPQGKDTLASGLLGESLLLFETVMVEDRSILEFVSADYAYLNNRLIDHYELAKPLDDQRAKAGMKLPPELEGQKGPAVNKARVAAGKVWLRAKLPDDTRGGVVTSGAVLTLTSLPTRTSTVKRGAWILETLYNRPPPEPTVAVEPLDNRRAADAGKTVRQKLEAHRADPNCMGCHSRIDPPGFALENFDPVGRWRTTDDGLAIDSRASFSDGRRFDGPAEFKRLLLKDTKAFATGFTEHLLSYALGRKLEHFDDTAVTEIVAAVEKDRLRFSRVVVEIVNSYPFRYTRNLPAEKPR